MSSFNWKKIAAYLSPGTMKKSRKVKGHKKSRVTKAPAAPDIVTSTVEDEDNNNKSPERESACNQPQSLPQVPFLDLDSDEGDEPEEEVQEEEEGERPAEIEGEEEEPNREKKTVSFDNGVLVYMDKSRHKDRQAMFYSAEEMELFRDDVANHQEEMSTEDIEADDALCLVGVEHHFLNGPYKQRQKLRAVLAVLMEQDRQFKEEGQFTPDDEKMSTCYQRVSRTSHREAHERGLRYFKSIRRDEDDSEDSEKDDSTKDDRDFVTNKAASTTPASAAAAAAAGSTSTSTSTSTPTPSGPTTTPPSESIQTSSSGSFFSPVPASPLSLRSSITSFSAMLGEAISTPKLRIRRRK
eukprot:scaffold431_cov103-Cylindrotheca_fusiformis.AAC.9